MDLVNGYQNVKFVKIYSLHILPTILYVIAYFCHFSPSLTITNLFYSFSPSVFNDGQWSVGPVLDSVYIPLLYEQILKERRKELIRMNEYKELQVINESLRHDNQSLQEALRETHSLSGKAIILVTTCTCRVFPQLLLQLFLPMWIYKCMYMSHLHFLLYIKINN